MRTINSVTNFMGEDHDRLEEIFREFQSLKYKDAAKAKALFGEFKTGLQRHIVWEEQILFPLFEDRTGMRDVGPTAVMRLEHRTIKEFLEKIHEGISVSNVQTEQLEGGLLEVLRTHNEKEEKILYPWIDNAVGERYRQEAFERMKNVPPEAYNTCCGKGAQVELSK